MLNSKGLEAAAKALQEKYREFWPGSWPDTETSRELFEAGYTAYLAHAGEPVRFPTAFCQPDDPDNSTAFSWPGTARSPRHTMPLYAAPQAQARVVEGRIEALAEFLCSEFDFDLDPVSGAHWPEHPKDDGYRDGGYVKLQPADVQAHARDNAKHILTFLDQRAATLAREAGQ